MWADTMGLVGTVAVVIAAAAVGLNIVALWSDAIRTRSWKRALTGKSGKNVSLSLALAVIGLILLTLGGKAVR
jgi:hypothetical protein